MACPAAMKLELQLIRCCEACPGNSRGHFCLPAHALVPAASHFKAEVLAG